MLLRLAPPLQVSVWFNVTEPLTLLALRGSVVVLHAFQMGCPGCIQLATPQAQHIHEIFAAADVKVIGLHSVFENHATMTPDALAKFIAERGLTFPIAVDEPDGENGIPLTMKALALDGTPSLVLLDRAGRIRMKRLGHIPDLELGAAIATLAAESG
ncbi:MAG: TlpA disulfide reductase family protein [Pseudomonadota bacterium]